VTERAWAQRPCHRTPDSEGGSYKQRAELDTTKRFAFVSAEFELPALKVQMKHKM
jgi:hypothetical protein